MKMCEEQGGRRRRRERRRVWPRIYLNPASGVNCTTTPCHLNMFHLLQVVIFLLCWMFVVEAGEQKVIWAQQSRSWTKLRGIVGAPTRWAYNNSLPREYVSSSAEHGRNWYALGLDDARDRVYWSDAVHGGIYVQAYTSAMYARPAHFRALLDVASQEVRGMAVDHASGNVYFTDAYRRWVAVTAASNHQTNIFRVLFSTRVDEPVGIAVDSARGLLYWADVGQEPRIETSTLQGTERRVLIRQVRTDNLAYDARDNRLYWASTETGSIQYLSLSSSASSPQTLTTSLPVGNDVVNYPGIAVVEDLVIISHIPGLKIVAFDKKTGQELGEQITDAIPHDVEAVSLSTVPDVACVAGSYCQDLCVNLGNGKGECGCRQNHYLEIDSTSCITSEPTYIYSIGGEVWRADVTIDGWYADRLTMNQTILDKTLPKAQALAVHYVKDYLYLADTILDIIYRGSPESLDYLTEITVNTKLVEGMSMDWVTDTLYWADGELGHVMCAQLDGRYHRIVLERDAGRERLTGLAVNPIHGRMYWGQYIENQGDSGAIMAAHMDGSSITTLLASGLSHPQAVTVDARKGRLYWTDKEQKTIEVANLDGTDRTELHRLDNVYGLTVFQDYSTWSQSEKGLRFGVLSERVELNTPQSGDPSQSLMNHRGDAFDVVLYGDYLQPTMKQRPNPCRDNNGGCQHHCVPLPSSYTCTCAIGFTLHENGKQCTQESMFDSFLLYVDPYHKQVYQQALVGGEKVQGLPLPLQDYPHSVDYDPYTGRVYWLDRQQGHLASSRLDGKEERVIIKFTNSMSPVRLAVHPGKELVCFTDSVQRALSCVRYDGSNMHNVITGLNEPYGIAIDTINDMLYWTEAGKVGRAQLDGKDQVYVSDLSSHTLTSPRAVAVWPEDGLVFWADEKKGLIVQLNTSSQTTETILERPYLTIHSLAADAYFVYFSTWHDKTLYRVSLNSTSEPELFHEAVFARITDIRLFDHGLPPPYDPVLGTEGDFPYLWVGVGAGALLLLLLLLGLIFGLGCRRKPSKMPPSGEDLGTGFDDNDVEREYMGFNNSTLFDMRNSRPQNAGTGYSNQAMTQDTPIRPEGGYAEDSYDSPLAHQANGHMDGYQNGAPGVTPEMRTSGDTPDVISGIAVAAVAAAGAPRRYKRKEQPPKHQPQTDPSTFEISEDTRVATVIARLANRLRNRLSTIRWSGGVGQTDPPFDPQQVGDPSQKAEDFVPVKRERVERNGNIVVQPQLHRPPRGYAPASPFVPSNVKNTWGRVKTGQRPPKNK